MKTIEQVVISHFPNARPGVNVTDEYLTALEKNYECDLKKVLFATSLCCDDINISTDFRRVLTRPFSMGGLGGLPYAGLTGMVAYGHHIPDNGDAFLFYGPHVGITDKGDLGKMRRPGQQQLTNSCGALMLALERFNNDASGTFSKAPNDWQQNLLEQTLYPHKLRILNASSPVKEITEITYSCIDQQLRSLIAAAASEFNCNRLFLLGGVIINTSPEHSDYVDIRNFEMIDLVNLRENTSGPLPKNDAFLSL